MKTIKHKRKKNQPFGIGTLFPRVNPSIGNLSQRDLEIVNGKIFDQVRLIEIANSNFTSINHILLFNPYLDSNNRLRVVNHILLTPNSKISKRRKFDYLSHSYEVHYYQHYEKEKLKSEIFQLYKSLKNDCVKMLNDRIVNLKKLTDIPQYSSEHTRQECRKIILSKSFEFDFSELQDSGNKSQEKMIKIHFYELVSEIISSIKLEQNQKYGAQKHLNDVTFAKLNSILPVSEQTQSYIQSLSEILRHPVCLCSVYFFRLTSGFSFHDFKLVMDEIQRFVNLYEENIVKALEWERKEIERMRIEKEEKLRLMAEKEAEIERLKREKELALVLAKEEKAKAKAELLSGKRGLSGSSIEPSTNNRW